jgi:hypothetical protein
MDTYGLINLTELDRMIEKYDNLAKYSAGFGSVADIAMWVCRLEAAKEIKELCLKLPSAKDMAEKMWVMKYNNPDLVEIFNLPDSYERKVFEAWYESYITQYTAK